MGKCLPPGVVSCKFRVRRAWRRRPPQDRKIAANDRIRIAIVGCGGMGTGDVNNAPLLANVSYFEKRICNWDPVNMTA